MAAGSGLSVRRDSGVAGVVSHEPREKQTGGQARPLMGSPVLVMTAVTCLCARPAMLKLTLCNTLSEVSSSDTE